MPNLIVNITFNPPVIKLMGSTLREETVQKLQSRLPAVTTTSAAQRKESPKFELRQNPSHWHLEIEQQYCDQLGRSLIFLSIIESLESEDWKLKGTNSVSHPENNKDTTKLFFVRA